MKHLLLAVLVLLSFTGCDDKEEQAKAKAKQEAKEERAIQLAQFEAQKAELKKAHEVQRVLEAEKAKLAQKAKESQDALEAKIAKEKEAKAKEEKRKEEAKAHKAKEETAKEDNSTLNAMGVEMTENSFSIDTTKTKVFIDELKAKVDSKIKTISEDLEKGIIQSKDAGIDINEKHIHIDLNKTQDILKDWGQKIQLFVNDFDSTTAENNKTNKGN